MVRPPRRPPSNDATAETRSGAASWYPLTPLPLCCCPPSPYARAAAAFCMPRCLFPTGTASTQTTTSCAARHLLSASSSISSVVAIDTRSRSIGTTRTGTSIWTWHPDAAPAGREQMSTSTKSMSRITTPGSLIGPSMINQDDRFRSREAHELRSRLDAILQKDRGRNC